MDDNTANIVKNIAEILLGIGGLSGLAAFVGQLMLRKKTNAEADKIVAETEKKLPSDAANTLAEASGKIAHEYQGLLDEHKKNTALAIESMEDEIEDLKKSYARRITYLLNGIQMLMDQIVGLGAKPCWSPNKSELDLPEDKKGS